MQEKIRVLVNGAFGRMGQMSVSAIQKENDFELVATCGRKDDLAQAIKQFQPNVVLELTIPECVYAHALTIIEHQVHPVIGATGLTLFQIEHLQKLCAEKKLGGIIAPNFSLAAIAMMRCAQKLAKHFPDMEIIEMHHQAKKDAPSATAIKTAQMISEARDLTLSQKSGDHPPSYAYGETHFGIPIHSIRLPGLVAHQRVLFGGHHETLTISHDAFNRESFMPGVTFSCRKVQSLTELVYGLDSLL